MSKIPIILQAPYNLPDAAWIQGRISDFNRQNGRYFVIMEQPDLSSPDNYEEMVAVRMATGKGPDILYSYAVGWGYDMVAKGGFEDLSPYMKESGMLEEDYFPFAFSCLREGEKIYTFRIRGAIGAVPSISCIRKELLGGREVSDIEELLDALLAWEGDAWLNSVAVSRWVLQMFYYSEDFGGMIDWEKGTCDFSNDLFVKMLRTAKKYGVSWEKALVDDYESRMHAEKYIDCTLTGYKTSAELEKMGLVNITSLIEGMDASIESMAYVIAINANSAQKEGAWEFLHYMMSEDVQMTMSDYTDRMSRHTHRTGMERILEWLNSEENATIGGEKTIRYLRKGEIIEEYEAIYTKDDMTQERIDEYLNTLENVAEHTTLAYVRLLPIYEIIEEEAEYYYSDIKSLEEVVDIINRRIGLYVGEQH